MTRLTNRDREPGASCGRRSTFDADLSDPHLGGRPLKRYLLMSALAIAALVLSLSAIGPAGRSHPARFAATGSPSPPRSATTTGTAQRPTHTGRRPTRARPSPPTATHTTSHETTTRPVTPVITAPPSDCRWRRYPDGAIGSDPECAPGQLDPAVVGRVAQTICNAAWLDAATRVQPPPRTLNRLLIEYQLPGNPATYALGHPRRGRRQPHQPPQPLPPPAQRLRRPEHPDPGRRSAALRGLRPPDDSRSSGKDADGRLARRGLPTDG